MIHHISIAAENPLKVVNVLAEIWKGKVFPFPPTAGGYIMVAFDAQGTAIEVFPQGTTLVPADLHPEIGHDPTATGYVPFHSAISVAADIAAIERVVEREGWKVQVGAAFSKSLRSGLRTNKCSNSYRLTLLRHISTCLLNRRSLKKRSMHCSLCINSTFTACLLLEQQ